MAAAIPLSYFLQTVPSMPPLPAARVDESGLLDDKPSPIIEIIDKDNEEQKGGCDQPQYLEKIPTNKNDDKHDAYSAPDIKTALIEAFRSPTFIMITLGFTVCGFHVSFLNTHFPAYCVSNLNLLPSIYYCCRIDIFFSNDSIQQDQGIDASLAGTIFIIQMTCNPAKFN